MPRPFPIALLLLVACLSPAVAGEPGGLHDLEDWVFGGCKHPPAATLERRTPDVAPLDRATRPLDVQHVDLELNFPAVEPRLEGRMTARVVLLDDATWIDLDLESETTSTRGLQVDGVWIEDAPTTFAHFADTLRVDLPAPRAAGDTTTVTVTYAGWPIEGGFPGFGLRLTSFLDADFEDDPTRPVFQTLSQPVGARLWWPSHDHPADAATVRLTVEAPPGFELAAPGRRTAVETLGDGRVRQTNEMTQPIPSYLLSLIVADFERWTEPITVQELLVDGTTRSVPMDLVYYAPSTRVADAEYTWQNTATMMERFEALWGPYPYAGIKYGNAVFRTGVAMEHATMSSIGDTGFTLSSLQSSLYPGPAGELVNAHELAHQWFGNAIRLGRWGDIWLNEGFARYAEVIWVEEFYGAGFARDYLDLLRERRDLWEGTLRDPAPNRLFSLVTYNKGALVLHMLRQVLGREGLHEAMRAYATDPALRHEGAVTIEDFRAHCEAVAGEDLAWFFEPWFERDTLPRVDVEWSTTAGAVSLRLSQPADDVFELPLPVRVHLDDGSHADFVVRLIDAVEDVTLDVDGRAVGVEIDPERNWLVDANVVARTRLLYRGARPNPFNPGTTIEFEVGRSTDVTIEIHDTRGRRVKTWTLEDVPPGLDSVLWGGEDDAGRAVASGVYHVRIRGSGRSATGKLTLVR